MAGLICLTAACPLRSALAASPAQDFPAMARMDDAKFKSILTRWEKNITGDARNRYCDKVMGEDIGWKMTPFMDGFYYGYLATHDTKWIDMLVDWTDSWVKRGVTEPDGYMGWPEPKAAGTEVDNLDSFNADSMLGEAMVLRSAVLMATEILKTPALKEKYGAKAESYVKLSEQVYEKWDKRGCWRETKNGGMISVVLPFGIDGNSGKWTSGYETRNAPGMGFSHPNNKANHVARWLLAMADVTQKSVYRERAEKWFTLMKSRMKAKDDGTYAIWNYWEPAGPWDYKANGAGATKHWVGVHPNTGYYQIDTDGIADAYQHGLVFGKEDIDRLIATALAAKRDWAALVPYNAELQKRFEAGLKPDSWAGLAAAPKYLALQAALPQGTQQPPAATQPPTARQPLAAPGRTITFDDKQTLVGWTITGDATIDAGKSRAGKSGALKVGAGAKAVLKLRDMDGTGKVEMWVYDDATAPENPKASRVGPRWGLMQNDGKVFAVGILYAGYLGGNEGYTATACDQKDWFNQLFWLGQKRAPAAWHKWTIGFDADEGLQIFHNDKPLSVVLDKADLKGFSSVAIWGDSGKGNEQTIWISDLAVTLGGPANVPVAAEANPYDAKAIAADPAVNRPVVVYTKDNAPKTPGLEELPLKESVSQYGMTWTFEKPARVGQFINGDWYVVGPVTVKEIDPKPLYGDEIPRNQLDHMDKERKEEQRIRNGFMLNPPAAMKVAYDSGVRNWFDPSLIGKLPVTMKPGDSLVSTISMPKGLVLSAPLRNKIERGVDDSSPIRTAAVLTCVAGPQPADALRPAFCDRQQRIYLARDLRRQLLPTAAVPKSLANVQQYIRFTQRPWLGTCFFGFEEPVENMPSYGLEYGRVAGISALLLCTDLKPEQKELLLVNYVQIGIDLGGMITNGHPGWQGFGGHGSGRKLPIVFAGLLLGDDQLANINKSFPKVSFGEDEQTAYGDGWTGAKVVFAGHRAIDAATGIARTGTGPYEHTLPSTWKAGDNTSEAYRRCCTSVGWVAQALALRLMHGETAWNHDAFFDYVDRWMYENDAEFVKTIKEATDKDHDKDFSRQGQAWDAFVNEMWAKHRPTLAAPTDGWKQKHDDAYYRAAIEKSTAPK
jgi:hypothetical protein